MVVDEARATDDAEVLDGRGLVEEGINHSSQQRVEKQEGRDDYWSCQSRQDKTRKTKV